MIYQNPRSWSWLKRSQSNFPIGGSESGASLLTAMVSLGIVSTMLAGFGLMLDNKVKQRGVEEGFKSRDAIYAMVRQAAKDPESIAYSANQPGNEQLKNCLNIVDKNSLGICGDAANPLQFALYTPMSAFSSPGLSQITAMSSTDIKGMFNRFGGKNCTGTSDCVFVASSKFSIECPGQSGDCQMGGQVIVRVNVSPNASWVPPEGNSLGLLKSSKIQDSGVNKEDPRVFIREIKKTAQRCPTGAYLAGLDEYGRALCKCLISQTGSLPAGQTLSCPVASCPIGQTLIGIKVIGVNPENPQETLFGADCRLSKEISTQCFDSPIDTKCPSTGTTKFGITGVITGSCVLPVPTTRRPAREFSRSVGCGFPGNPMKSIDCWFPKVMVSCSGWRVRCCPIP